MGLDQTGLNERLSDSRWEVGIQDRCVAGAPVCVSRVGDDLPGRAGSGV